MKALVALGLLIVIMTDAPCAAQAKLDAAPDPGLVHGHMLLGTCQGGYGPNGSDFFRGNCTGYISAIVDVLMGGNIAIAGSRACPPKSLTVGEAQVIAWRYLEKNPDFLKFPASWIVARSIAEAYPCS